MLVMANTQAHFTVFFSIVNIFSTELVIF